jgi:hypothetical protein
MLHRWMDQMLLSRFFIRNLILISSKKLNGLYAKHQKIKIIIIINNMYIYCFPQFLTFLSIKEWNFNLNHLKFNSFIK